MNKCWAYTLNGAITFINNALIFSTLWVTEMPHLLSQRGPYRQVRAAMGQATMVWVLAVKVMK